MNYYKQTDGDYIIGVSSGSGSGNISEAEYQEILAAIQSAPTPPEGYGCRLRTDLAWELYPIPPEPEQTDYAEDDLLALTNAELQRILTELGISTSMSKANMVRLILAAQEAIT